MQAVGEGELQARLGGELVLAEPMVAEKFQPVWMWFADADGGGFFLTASDGQRLIARSKPAYDGSVPCGNSVAALALLRLGQATMQPKFIDNASKSLETFSAQLQQSPTSLIYMLMAVDFCSKPSIDKALKNI